MARQISNRTQIHSLTDRKSAASKPGGVSLSSPDDRRHRIAVAAYFKAKERGFAQGRALEDWLEAEKEIEALSSGEASHADTSG